MTNEQKAKAWDALSEGLVEKAKDTDSSAEDRLAAAIWKSLMDVVAEGVLEDEREQL